MKNFDSVNSARKYLYSEADVLMQINNTLVQLKAHSIILMKHVNSHQDDDKAFQDLSWPEKLNVYCDQLATTKLKEIIDDPSGIVPFLPASQILLTINNIAIRHHVPFQIRHLWGKMAHRKYLTNHHDWTDDAFDNIHWELFCQTLLSHSFKKRLFLIKWTNLILPFNQKYYSYNICGLPKCPSNCSHEKNEHHFLWYQQVHCQNLKQKLLHHDLSKTFNTHNIDPYLRKICIAFLTDDITIFTAPFLHTYTHTIYLQRQLGDNSLYYGYFFSDWYVVQRNYLRTLTLKMKHNQAEIGIKAIMYTIYVYVYNLWILRNSHCHCGVTPGSTSFARQTLLQELQALYEAPKDILTTNRDFFAMPIN